MFEFPQPFGHYILEEELGAGGMAVTYRARERLGAIGERLVAIKKILPEHASDANFHRMFLDEAAISAMISHHNVCRVFQAGEIEGTLFMAMEFVDGPSLSSLAKAQGAPFPIEHGLFIGAEVLNGLHAAHTLTDPDGNALHVVHRDVSPQNVLVSRQGGVKLIDFGIAKAVTNRSMTQTGAVKGKLLYFSPEQLESQPLDARSDVFATGMMLYELLTSWHPLAADSDAATIFNFITKDIPLPSSVRPELPNAVDAVLMRALAREREARWPDAMSFSRALVDVLHDVSPRYRPHALEKFVGEMTPHGAGAMAPTMAGQLGAATLPPHAVSPETARNIDAPQRVESSPTPTLTSPRPASALPAILGAAVFGALLAGGLVAVLLFYWMGTKEPVANQVVEEVAAESPTDVGHDSTATLTASSLPTPDPPDASEGVAEAQPSVELGGADVAELTSPTGTGPAWLASKFGTQSDEQGSGDLETQADDLLEEPDLEAQSTAATMAAQLVTTQQLAEKARLAELLKPYEELELAASCLVRVEHRVAQSQRRYLMWASETSKRAKRRRWDSGSMRSMRMASRPVRMRRLWSIRNL